MRDSLYVSVHHHRRMISISRCPDDDVPPPPPHTYARSKLIEKEINPYVDDWEKAASADPYNHYPGKVRCVDGAASRKKQC